MTTRLDNTNRDLRVFQTFADFLKDTWKEDSARSWDHYFKKQQFTYFWDTAKDAQK
jgi:hypothetical protein